MKRFETVGAALILAAGISYLGIARSHNEPSEALRKAPSAAKASSEEHKKAEQNFKRALTEKIMRMNGSC